MRIASVAIFLIILSLNCISQETHSFTKDLLTKFENYTELEGLSSNQILDIEQDEWGFIWIATSNGLNRYDGYRFVQFLNDPKDSTSISNNFISDIVIDSSGTLWIATHDGLNRYDRNSESFIRYKNNPSINSLRNNHIRAIAIDSIYLWLETLDGTLTKYDPAKNKYEHHKHVKITQPYYNYHALLIEKDKIWLGGRNMGPVIFDKNSKTFFYLDAGFDKPLKKREKDLACVYRDRSSTVWISGLDGLYEYSEKDSTFNKIFGTSTYSIIQDRKGYLWVGTGNGLLKYDKENNHFIQYQYNEQNLYSIIDNHINTIFQSTDGNIWIGTDKGLSKLNRVKTYFNHLYNIPEQNQSLASNKVTTIAEDDKGNLWVGYQDDGLDRLNLETQTYKHFNTDNTDKLASNRVSELYIDNEENLWIGLWSGLGFNRINLKNGKIDHYAIDPDSRKRDWYNDFLEDESGTFWLGVWGSVGLLQFDREKQIILPDHYIKRNAPREIPIRLILNDGNNIWTVSNNKFIYRLELKTSKNYAYDLSPHNQQEPEHEPSSGITSIPLFRLSKIIDIYKWLDNSEIIFTTENGIIIYNSCKDKFKAYPLSKPLSIQHSIQIDSIIYLTTETQFIKFNVSSYKYDNKITKLPVQGNQMITGLDRKNSNLLILTSNQEIIELANDQQKKINIQDINLYDSTLLKKKGPSVLFKQILNNKPDSLQWIGETGKIIEIIHNQIGSARVNTVFIETNNIWIGTNNGLFHYNKHNNQVKHFYYKKEVPSLINNMVLSVTTDNVGNLFVGTESGFCKFDKAAETFISFNKPPSDGLSSHLVSCLFEDSQCNLWVGTTNYGVNKIDKARKHVEHFYHDPFDSTSISSNTINCIFEDSKENLWIGTEKGLNVLKKNSSEFTHDKKPEFLPGENIQSILQKDSGSIWVTSDYGLSHINLITNKVRKFHVSEGLQGSGFSKAALVLNNGNIAIGGENGLNVFNPEDLLKINYKANIEFTSFQVFDEFLRNDLSGIESIQLTHNQNFFTIHFSALNYLTQNVQYFYFLEGIDNDWVFAGATPKASYTDIKHGNYKLKIKALFPDGEESKIKSLKIKISPPFYKTKWFFIIIFLVISFVVFKMVSLNIKKYKSEIAKMELEMKFLRSQMNPHFIFNAMTSIQNFLFDKDFESANLYLTKFSKLLRLALESTSKNFITIEEEINTIKNYIALQMLRFDNNCSYELTIDEKIDTSSTMIPPMMGQPFIENAIVHGFINSRGKNILDIHFKLADDFIIYTIEDNGIGINKSLLDKEGKTSFHKSLGTEITNKRASILSILLKKKISIEIIDKSEESISESGTLVRIKIPYIH